MPHASQLSDCSYIRRSWNTDFAQMVPIGRPTSVSETMTKSLMFPYQYGAAFWNSRATNVVFVIPRTPHWYYLHALLSTNKQDMYKNANRCKLYSLIPPIMDNIKVFRTQVTHLNETFSARY
jgi:hypothetical protein